MIGVSRVFDLEGLWEVLGEIGGPSDHTASDGDDGDDEEEVVSNQQQLELDAEVEIPNSEDDDSTPPWEDNSSPAPPHLEPLATAPAPRKEDDGVEILIIDSLTHIINELFSRKERNDGSSTSPSYPRALSLPPSLQNRISN